MLDNLINGRWHPPHSGFYLNLSRSTDDQGRPVRVARSDSTDVDVALNAARHALAGWRDLEPAERESLIEQIPTLVGDRRMDHWLEQCCARINGDKAIANGAVEGFRQDFVSAFDLAITAVQARATASAGEAIRSDVACLVFGAASPPMTGLTQVFRALIEGSTVVVTALFSTRQQASAVLPSMLCAVAGCLPAGVINILLGLGLDVCSPLTLFQHPSSAEEPIPNPIKGHSTAATAPMA